MVAPYRRNIERRVGMTTVMYGIDPLNVVAECGAPLRLFAWGLILLELGPLRDEVGKLLLQELKGLS